MYGDVLSQYVLKGCEAMYNSTVQHVTLIFTHQTVRHNAVVAKGMTTRTSMRRPRGVTETQTARSRTDCIIIIIIIIIYIYIYIYYIIIIEGRMRLKLINT